MFQGICADPQDLKRTKVAAAVGHAAVHATSTIERQLQLVDIPPSLLQQKLSFKAPLLTPHSYACMSHTNSMSSMVKQPSTIFQMLRRIQLQVLILCLCTQTREVV
jgi:hypothetical protein